MSGHERAATTDEAYPPLRRNRNFRRYLVGKFVSNAGDSLYSVAILWLVFELSGSTVLTGVANSLLLLPYLLQIVAGPLVDRLPLKGVMVGTQAVQGVVVLALPLAGYTGTLSVPFVLVLIPALSLMTLAAAPVQSTLVPRIVADDQLSRSNSALATVTLGLDMIFDALGGLFIAVFGATTLFLLDSVTFAVASVLFAGMTVPTIDGGEERESAVETYIADMRAGIEILRGTLFVDMLLTAAVFNFAVGVTLAILPSVGARLGGPAFYGLLLGALGVGRLVGSVAAPSLNGVAYGRLVAVTHLIGALCWIASVSAPSALLSVCLFALAWTAAGLNDVLTETLNQRVFPADILGRVSAIKGTASTATLPLGSLVGGVIAAVLGTEATMALAALGFGFVGGFFALRPSLRTLPAVSRAEPADFGVQVPDEPSD